MTTALRRTLFLVVLAVLGGAAYSWWNGRKETQGRPAPDWPPIVVAPDGTPASDPTWVPAEADGSCPDGYPVKVKAASGIYHVPGGRFHERTRPDRCYATAVDAEADGYRRSKS